MSKFKIGDRVKKYNMFTKRYASWYVVEILPKNIHGAIKYNLSKVKDGGAGWFGYEAELEKVK